jgi:hypothetical protein
MAAAILGPQPLERDSEQSVAALDNLIAHRAEAPSSQRWGISNALWVFRGTTTQELIDEISKYDLTEVADQITGPTLVCEAENDHFFSGRPRRLYDAPHCPKTFLTFTAAEGAGDHCHVGALTLFHQRMFDWLDLQL